MPARNPKKVFILGAVFAIAVIALLIVWGDRKKEGSGLNAKPTPSSSGSLPDYPPGPDPELNTAKAEVAALSDAEIEQETAKYGAKIRENDLIHRLNREEVSEEERKAAKKILVRLALLRIEKAKRTPTR